MSMTLQAPSPSWEREGPGAQRREGEGAAVNRSELPATLTRRARRLRREQTHCEAILWSRLRRRGLASRKFHRQFVLGNYIVDFVCFEERLIVEVDGGQHNAADPAEAARTCWLESQGFRVLRFWNTDVEQALEGVLETIQATFIMRGER